MNNTDTLTHIRQQLARDILARRDTTPPFNPAQHDPVCCGELLTKKLYAGVTKQSHCKLPRACWRSRRSGCGAGYL